MKNPYKVGITLLVIAGVALVAGIVLFFVNLISSLLCIGISACLGWSGYSTLAAYVRDVNIRLQAERSARKAMETEEDNSDEIEED